MITSLFSPHPNHFTARSISFCFISFRFVLYLFSPFARFSFLNLRFFFFLQNYAAKHPDSQSLLDSVNNKYYYYTRTRGLFRICYPKERPPASAGKCLVSCQNTKLRHGMSLLSLASIVILKKYRKTHKQ